MDANLEIEKPTKEDRSLENESPLHNPVVDFLLKVEKLGSNDTKEQNFRRLLQQLNELVILNIFSSNQYYSQEERELVRKALSDLKLHEEKILKFKILDNSNTLYDLIKHIPTKNDTLSMVVGAAFLSIGGPIIALSIAFAIAVNPVYAAMVIGGIILLIVGIIMFNAGLNEEPSKNMIDSVVSAYHEVITLPDSNDSENREDQSNPTADDESDKKINNLFVIYSMFGSSSLDSGKEQSNHLSNAPPSSSSSDSNEESDESEYTLNYSYGEN